MPQKTVDVLFRKQMDHLLVEHVQRFSEDSLAKNKHFHAHLEIYYLVSGERNYHIRGRNYHVRAGDLVVISGNIMHRTFPVGDCAHERILLEIYTPMLHTVNALFGDQSPERMLTNVAGIFHLDPTEQGRVLALLRALMQEMDEQRYGHDTMVSSILAQLLTFVVRNAVESPSERWENSESKNAKMVEISNYLAAHSAEKMSLDDISERFSISKYHLCRTFKDMTGFTISEYVNASRVMHARELLMTTTLSIAEIAKEAGFESSTHFGKVFKQLIGKSPLHFRKYG